MLELLRKHQHGIMIVVAFIVIIAFAWLFNPYDTRAGSLNQEMALRIGDKGITVKEVERQGRILQVASDLGFDFTMQLLQPTFDVVDFTQNRFLLGKETRRLGIEPTEEEVQRAIAEHPEFRPDGRFSEDRYLAAINDTLEPNGLVAGDLRELVADKIRIEKLTALLASNVEVPSTVVDVEFQRERERVTASVIDFQAEDFEAEVEVTDEELRAYYDEQQALLPTLERRAEGRLTAEEEAAVALIMTPERRSAEFVFFAEPAEASPPAPTAPSMPVEPEPPLLLQPGDDGAGAGGALTPPPLELSPEPVDILQEEPGDGAAEDESEPPGQAPEGEDDGLQDLEIEPLPAAPGGLDGVELTAPEDLPTDVNVGGFGDDAPAEGGEAPSFDVDLGDLGDLQNLGGAQQLASPAGAGGAFEAQKAAKRAFLQDIDTLYMAVLEDPAELGALAEKEGVELKVTGLFSQDEPPTSPSLPPALVDAIFRGSLETDQGVLVPVESFAPKGYYLARLLQVEKPAEIAFDDAKEALREKLVEKKAAEKMEEAAKEARTKLVEAIESGKTFAAAVEELGLEAREVPPFSLSQPPAGIENAQEVAAAVRTTTTGSVSEMQRAGEKALLVYVSRREAAPETKEQAAEAGVADAGAGDPAAEKQSLAESLQRQASGGLLPLWLEDQREAVEVERYLEPIIYFPTSLRRSLGF